MRRVCWPRRVSNRVATKPCARYPNCWVERWAGLALKPRPCTPKATCCSDDSEGFPILFMACSGRGRGRRSCGRTLVSCHQGRHLGRGRGRRPRDRHTWSRRREGLPPVGARQGWCPARRQARCTCLQLVPSTAVAAAQPEHAHRLDQVLGLVLQAGGGRRHLLDQGRVLLCGLIHLRHRITHLGHARALLTGGRADLAHDVAHPADGGHHLTHWLPWSTRSTLAEIRVLISLAASALRPARARTSPATTAKPRPCSPARAASTAAFSARMLVWKAMPSMTPMMSAIFWLL